MPRNGLKSVQTWGKSWDNPLLVSKKHAHKKLRTVFKEVRSNLEAYIFCSVICNKIISFCILSDKFLTLLVAPHNWEVKCEQKKWANFNHPYLFNEDSSDQNNVYFLTGYGHTDESPSVILLARSIKLCSCILMFMTLELIPATGESLATTIFLLFSCQKENVRDHVNTKGVHNQYLLIFTTLPSKLLWIYFKVSSYE